jgi:bisphosphoglycerate-dependent phosphoglycerate mutase family 1
MAKLVLVRHSKSEWNVLGKWTGWTDVDLNEEGREDAKRTAEAVKNIHFDQAFVSNLKRAQQTLEIILKEIEQESVPTIKTAAINERDYGIYTGKNKNDLTRSVLSKLKITGQAVIYADRCLVDEEDLKKKGIIFKQIPYEIKVY